MKKTLTFIIAAVFSMAVYAQNEIDALRYSQINYGGTARFTGMSGAYGAIGADFSSLSQNPAGIALYRKSELTFTPMISNGNTESRFLNNTNTDSRNTFYVGNAGYVMSIKLPENNAYKMKQIQFGFGVNRMATFSSRALIDGQNNENSLVTKYLNDADQSGSDPENLYYAPYNFGAALAYDTKLIYQDTNNVWQSDLPFGGLNQTKNIETRGGTTETVLSAGSNFADKFFVGMTFAFPRINYQEDSYYFEKDNNSLSPFLKSFDRTEYLHTTGNGFNFKIGFIYKPIDFVRIGGAFHTPTYYSNVHDVYNASMIATYDQPPLATSNATVFDASSPNGDYEYDIRTPLRAMGSLAFILGQYGLISADYEYIDYSTAHLRAFDYNFSSENSTIRTAFTAANNIRIGTEWKAGNLAFRGGYNIYGSPYKGEGMTGRGSRSGYSFGFGVREEIYFFDFSFSHSSMDDNYYLYNIAPATANTYNSNSYSLTLGLRL